jgi:hypothetical protein
MTTFIKGVPEMVLINYIENLTVSVNSQVVSGKSFDETNQAIFFKNLLGRKFDNMRLFSKAGEDRVVQKDEKVVDLKITNRIAIHRKVKRNAFRDKEKTRKEKSKWSLEEYPKDCEELVKSEVFYMNNRHKTLRQSFPSKFLKTSMLKYILTSLRKQTVKLKSKQ